ALDTCSCPAIFRRSFHDRRTVCAGAGSWPTGQPERRSQAHSWRERQPTHASTTGFRGRAHVTPGIVRGNDAAPCATARAKGAAKAPRSHASTFVKERRLMRTRIGWLVAVALALAPLALAPMVARAQMAQNYNYEVPPPPEHFTGPFGNLFPGPFGHP